MLALHELARAATTYEVAEVSGLPPRVVAQILRNNQHGWVEKCGEVEVKGKPVIYPTWLWKLVGTLFSSLRLHALNASDRIHEICNHPHWLSRNYD